MKSLKFIALLMTLLCASFLAQAQDRQEAQAEANKKLVLDFYNAALTLKDVDAAVKYLGESYVQHNPRAADGVEGVRGLIKFLKESQPNRSSSIKRVIAEKDLVVIHVHAKSSPEDRGTAIIDIFRVANGKIVEHWDVMQAVPEKASNTNTMF